MKNWSFGIDNDNLVKLVLAGKKTATTYLYNKEDVPIIGEESIIHFDNEKNACVVKTKEYHILKFKDVTEELAKLEGEGDLSLSYWQKAHTDFFKSFSKNFNDETEIIFEIFEVTKNLVQERLQLGELIATKNKAILGETKNIYEVNAGFNNTIFSVNNKYIIKVCTNRALEETFEKEYTFYIENKSNQNIPKLYKYDKSKQEIPYVYEIIEQIPGRTLYYFWYKMTETEREETIKKLITIVKKLHSSKVESFDWVKTIKNKVKENIGNSKELFTNTEYNTIEKSLELYDEYLKDNKFAFIHNDLHFDNIIYHDKKLTIIDFNDCMIAPIDFEFRQIYACQEKPWKWANTEMDPLQKPKDYKNVFNYVKKYYESLNNIQYLEKRMIIYKILDSSKHLKKYKSKELINDIIINTNKLLTVEKR